MGQSKEGFIKAASIITLIFSGIYGVLFIAIFVFATLNGKIASYSYVLLLSLVIFALGFLSGWGLRKFAKWAGILSIAFNSINIYCEINNPASIVFSVLIIILVILGWKALR